MLDGHANRNRGILRRMDPPSINLRENVGRAALLYLFRFSNDTPARPISAPEFLKKKRRRRSENLDIRERIYSQGFLTRAEFIVFIGIAVQTQIQYPEHNNIVLIYRAGTVSAVSVGGGGGEGRRANERNEEESWRLGAAGKKSPLFAPFCLHVD